jgi:peptidoglycan/xylan/chitin deacetylase (PgdA/CDA1 family)
MAIVAGLTLAGCSQGTSPLAPAPTSSSPASVPQADFAHVDESMIGGLAKASLSGKGVQSTVPAVTGATPFSLAAQIVRNKALRARAKNGGTTTVTWQAIASSSDVLGALVTVHTSGGTAGDVTVPVSLWYDESADTVATGAVLISPASWDAFSAAAASAVGEQQGGDAAKAAKALASPGAPQGFGPAIGFNSDGDLIVSFGGGTAGTTTPLTVRIDKATAQDWLSEFGLDALGAATHPSNFAAGSDGSAPKTLSTAKSGTRTDADVVGDCKARKCISLTFDDGPSSQTGEVVDAFTKAGQGATFFQLGDMIQEIPSGVKTVALRGSEVASHTWRHVALTTQDDTPATYQVKHNAQELQKITGEWPIMIRPPYGDHNPRINKVIAKQGQVIVQWSVDTLDWKTLSTEKTIEAATKAQAGDIVLMHDIHPTTVAAVPDIVRNLTEAGFTLVPVSELSSPNSWKTGVAYCSAPWRKEACW